MNRLFFLLNVLMAVLLAMSSHDLARTATLQHRAAKEMLKASDTLVSSCTPEDSQ